MGNVRPRYVNTRLKEQAPGLNNLLSSLGADVWEFPLVSLIPQTTELSREFLQSMCQPENWLVLTSAMGASVVCERLKELHFTTELSSSLVIAAIGEQTRKAIASYGFAVAFTPQVSNSENFAREFLEHLKTKAVGTIFLLRGNLADRAFEDSLSQAGYRIQSKVVYETRAYEPNQSACAGMMTFLEQGEPERRGIVLFHSEAVRLLRVLVAEGKLPNSILDEKIYVVGPKTAQTAHEQGFRQVIVAAKPNIESLVEKMPREK